MPLDVHVVGEPLVLVAVEYDGNARRGLVARCRREDGSEYRIGLADVEMPARTSGARHVAAYRAWVGIVPDAGAAATTPRSRRQHKAGDDDVDLSRPVELVVLAVKERAARCRLLGSGRVITLRAGSLYGIVAGHVVTVTPNKHWRHSGHPYLSGQIAGTRIDASTLGLVPLALRAAGARDAGVEDLSAPSGRSRRAFELEVPPVPAGLAATNIDDPDAVAEKLLEGAMQRVPERPLGRPLDTLVDLARVYFATPRPARGPRWPSEGPPERLVYLLDHEYTQKGLAWGRLKNGDAVRAALLREVADRLDCEITHRKDFVKSTLAGDQIAPPGPHSSPSCSQ